MGPKAQHEGRGLRDDTVGLLVSVVSPFFTAGLAFSIRGEDDLGLGLSESSGLGLVSGYTMIGAKYFPALA